MSLDFYLEEIVTEKKDVFEGNITGNLCAMWIKAGIYEVLYDSKGKKAKEIINPLKLAVKDMEEKPKEYKLLNPKNGWGDYDGALKWIKELLESCIEHPESIINVNF
jgi:hypothetical protein